MQAHFKFNQVKHLKIKHHNGCNFQTVQQSYICIRMHAYFANLKKCYELLNLGQILQFDKMLTITESK